MARFFNPIPQYLDGSARVYAGAKIYFYENGTTTPQATYSDAALSVANSNPVVCDSEGRTPPIFVPDDDTYTVVFTDADDVQFASIDDFVGADGNVSSADVVAALAANTAALTIAGASVAITPATTITGALTANGGISTTTFAASGNSTVGGTLGVTGASTFSSSATVTGDLTTSGFLGINTSSELTISSGVVTATQSAHTIDTEGDAATDTCSTINGGSEGQLVWFKTENNGRDVTFDQNGNIRLGGISRTLDNTLDEICFKKSGSVWLEQFFADNS